MSYSNNDQEGSIQICRANRTILQYSLLWPDDGTELNPRRIYKFKLLVFFLVTGVMTFSSTLHCVLAITNSGDMDTEEIAVLIAIYGTYYMVAAYIKKQHQVALLLRDLSNFDKFGRPPGFEKVNKNLNACVKFSFIFSFVSVVFYSFMKFLEKSECEEMNSGRGANGNYCGLICTMWIPFSIDYFPVFQLCVIYLVLTAHLLLKMCQHISLNALEMVHHIILRHQHLKLLLLDCFESDCYEISRRKLNTCIIYHIEILSFTKRLDDTFFNSMFGHFALTGAICACLGKQILDGHNVYAGVLHFLGWILALFIGCVGGQDLLNANEIIPEAIWTSKWYESDLRLKKDLLFMLARSQKRFSLRAGPFGILSYPLFVSVLKTSYSILCVLTS